MSRKSKKRQYLKSFDDQWNLKKGSRHHILPASRGGHDNNDNISVVNHNLHELFHDLFINRTPEECVEFLVEYFFNGDFTILETIIKRRNLENGNLLFY